MKAEHTWTVMATVHKEVTHLIMCSVLNPLSHLFVHSQWVILPYNTIHAATVNESCLSVCECTKCMCSCLCNCMHPCKSRGRRVTWVSVSITFHFIFWGRFWMGMRQVLNSLSRKCAVLATLTGHQTLSVYLCNPQPWGSRWCCHAWNYLPYRKVLVWQALCLLSHLPHPQLKS